MNSNNIKIILMLCVLLSSKAAMTQETNKPNIILILADDLGYADLSMNGSLQINTPNIDALANEGVNLTQAYVSAPVCSPSRAGLLTGKNQVRFGYDNNLTENAPAFDPEYAGLPIGERTLADFLKDQGYVTGLVGKWHLGSKEQFQPQNRGFDEFWGYLGGGHDYFRSNADGKGYLSPLVSNFKKPQEISYITDDKGDECVDFIIRNRDKPFFLYASFNAPHAPLQALEEDLELFRHVKDKKRRAYLAMVHRLDLNVGKISQTLKSQGLEDNTIIVFLSDNGGPVDQNSSNNAPLNGQKGILMEGGIRVPFIMKWKGVINPGIVYNHPVTSLDLVPTFLEAAGLTPSIEYQFDGVNILPYIKEEIEGKPHDVFMWRFTISAGILEGNWKLIRLPDRLPMLFDLSKDISEQNNVAIENPEITRSLLKKLGNWDLSLPHPIFLEGSNWKVIQRDLYDIEYKITQPGKD